MKNKQLVSAEYNEEKMSVQIALKYLEEFSKQNNLNDDSSTLVVHSVDYIKKEIKSLNNKNKIEAKKIKEKLLEVKELTRWKTFAQDKSSKEDLIDFYEGK